MTSDHGRDDPGFVVIGYLAEVAHSIPELGLRTAEVDALARGIKDCADIDPAALQQDSRLVRMRVARAEAVPTALEHVVAALPAGLAGHGGAAAVHRAACGAAVARKDLVQASTIADTLTAAATGIEDVQAQLARRLNAVDVSGIGDHSILAVRQALDNGDVEQGQINAWAAAIQTAVDVVASGVADTRRHLDSILGVVVSTFDSIPTAPFHERVHDRTIRETSFPATDSVGVNQLDALDLMMRAATAAGSLAENVVNMVSSGIEATAAITSESPEGDDVQPTVDDADERPASVPSTDQPSQAEVEPADPAYVAPDPPVADTAATVEQIPPVQPRSQQPVPAPDPQPAPDAAADSGLALLGDG